MNENGILFPGDRAKIVAVESHHGFALGETVTLLGKHFDDMGWLATNNTDDWFVYPSDVQLIIPDDDLVPGDIARVIDTSISRHGFEVGSVIFLLSYHRVRGDNDPGYYRATTGIDWFTIDRSEIRPIAR